MIRAQTGLSAEAALQAAYEYEVLAAKTRNERLRRDTVRLSRKLQWTVARLVTQNTLLVAGFVVLVNVAGPNNPPPTSAVVLAAAFCCSTIALAVAAFRVLAFDGFARCVASFATLPLLPEAGRAATIHQMVARLAKRLGVAIPVVHLDRSDLTASAAVVKDGPVHRLRVGNGVLFMLSKSSEQVEALLCHELAHLRQQDSDLLGQAHAAGAAASELRLLQSNWLLRSVAFVNVPELLAFQSNLRELEGLMCQRQVAALASEGLADFAAMAYCGHQGMGAYVEQRLAAPSQDELLDWTHPPPRIRAWWMECEQQRALATVYVQGSRLPARMPSRAAS